MTTWPYDPSQPSGDWQVSLPGDASIGELLVYQSETAVPSTVLVPDSTGCAALVKRISGTGGVGTVYPLRYHYGSGITPPSTTGFQWEARQAYTTPGGIAGRNHRLSGATGTDVTIDNLVVTTPRAGAIEYQFEIALLSGGDLLWLEGLVGAPPYNLWAGATVMGVMVTNYRADNGDPNTFTAGAPDGYMPVLTGPAWPYPYFTGGTPAP